MLMLSLHCFLQSPFCVNSRVLQSIATLYFCYNPKSDAILQRLFVTQRCCSTQKNL